MQHETYNITCMTGLTDIYLEKQECFSLDIRFRFFFFFNFKRLLEREPLESFCEFPVLSCSRKGTQDSLELQMTLGQPEENLLRPNHHPPRKLPLQQSLPPASSPVSGGPLPQSLGLAPAGREAQA